MSCNRLLSAACDYPLHLGVTEAGLYTAGLVKSAIGIGAQIACKIIDLVLTADIAGINPYLGSAAVKS